LAKGEAVGVLQDAVANGGSAGVRQAALHSVALHRDARAVNEAVQMLRDPSDALKRVAAEALGRISDPVAVAPLLEAAALTEGEVLTHSLIYALIEIADTSRTRAGLKAASARTRRAAMIALDQMRPAALEPSVVLSRLDSQNEPVAQAARWIASRHPEWGGQLAGYLGRRLAGVDGSRYEELLQQLIDFSRNEAVQTLLAKTVQGDASATAKAAALAAMANAPVEEVPRGWTDAIADALGNEQTRDAGLQAVRRLPRPEQGLPSLDRAVLAVARDGEMDPSSRVRALDAGRDSLEALEPPLFELARSQVLPDEPVASRAAAARVLATVPLDKAQLMELAGLLPEIGPLELPRIVESFGQSDDAELGINLLRGLSQATGLANLRADILQAAVEGYPPDVRVALDALIEGGVTGLEEQNAKLDGLLATLPQGDVVRGQGVFNSSETACLSCHAIGYQGGRIGPDLTRIGEIRERRDLLEAIVFPSASFVRSYEPIVAVTEAESINGVPVEESETHLLLAVNADEQVRIPRADIEEVRPGTVSVMPSGLDEQLSAGQLADLLAFLEATQWGPNRSRP
jgi:putative heme-binding domain-containing protein